MDAPFKVSIKIPKEFEPFGHARKGCVSFDLIETKNYSHFTIDNVMGNAGIGAKFRQFIPVKNQQIRYGQKYFHNMGRKKSFIWSLFIF